MTRIYVIGDSHISTKLNQRRFTDIGKDIKYESPDILVQIGDFASFDSLSRYESADSYSGRTKPLLKSEFRACGEAQERLSENSGYRGPRYITEGNHEHRLDTYSNANPATWGLIRAPYDATLAEHGWEVHPYGKIIKLERVGFTHVPFNILGRPYGGKTADYRIANDSGIDLVYGHTHRAGVVRLPHIGSGHITAINVGCSLPWGHLEDYAKFSTTGWWWGCVVLEVNKGKIEGWNFKSMKEIKANAS